MQSESLSFGPFTIKELAGKYRKEMHVNTFENMIRNILTEYAQEEAGVGEGYYLPPHVVAEIYCRLGPPDCYWVEYKKLEMSGLGMIKGFKKKP